MKRNSINIPINLSLIIKHRHSDIRIPFQQTLLLHTADFHDICTHNVHLHAFIRKFFSNYCRPFASVGY